MPAKRTMEDLVKVCEAQGITVVSREYTNNSTKLRFWCKCGYVFDTKPMLLFAGKGCRRCAVQRREATMIERHGVTNPVFLKNAPSASKEEVKVEDAVLGFSFVIDGFMKTAQVSEKVKVTVVDLAKTPAGWNEIRTMREKAEAEGGRHLFFYSKEWNEKRKIVEQIVNNALGRNLVRIPARKCEIEEIECAEFFQSTHLMGDHKHAHDVALVFEGRIVCAMSYRKKDEGIDISRFSCESGVTVQGGFSKLLKYIEEKKRPKYVYCFTDFRYGTGEHLLAKGFKNELITTGFNWTDCNGVLHNRLKCRANICERRLTEKQQAIEWGWWRVYDAGQSRFVKRQVGVV